MVKLPTPDVIQGPDSLRPSGRPIPVDTSALAQGVGSIARGIGGAANALDEMAGRQQQQEMTVDLATAEAEKTKALFQIQTAFAQDPNYGDFEKRATPQIDDAINNAALKIRDERMRERWLAEQQGVKVQNLDAILAHGQVLKNDAEVAGLETSLTTNAQLVTDPTVPPELRAKARQDIAGAIAVAQDHGLILPTKAVELRDKYVTGADNALAVNTAELDIRNDPQGAKVRLAVPSGAATGTAMLAAQEQVDGAPLMLDYSLARVVAHGIGDANFPTDPKLLKAYLSDPQMQQRYAEAAQAQLLQRYKGDMTAVVIAMDPNGGTALADRWMAGGRSPRVLPPAVRKRTDEVMSSLTAPVRERIPVTAALGVDLATYDPSIVANLERMQSSAGVSLPIIPSDKSHPLGARAVTVDISGIPQDQRATLIAAASAAGFTGIGVGKDTLELDTGDTRSWGPDGTAASIPAWAKPALAAHANGTTVMPTLNAQVAPEYRALTFDQRLQLDAKAQAAMNNRNVADRASLVTIEQNAPAAIAQTGAYDTPLPTANDYVRAYGAVEGIQRYQQLQANVDVAQSIFGMRTMPADEISAMVQGAIPTSQGNDAALQQKRYETLQNAANTIRDARAKDPAGYVLDAFPAVGQAFQAAMQDRRLMPAALAAMSAAQTELGIAEPRLLPDGMSSAAVTAFKDTTLPAPQRIASIAGLVLSTTDTAQQDQIFGQLVHDGLPPMTGGALNAMRRGDVGAAQNLLRAVMFDPNDVKIKMPDGQSDDEIRKTMQEDVFSAGKVGDIVYGVQGGSTGNLEQAAAASELLFRSAKLRLLDGSAGGNLDKAVQMAARDLFGDVQAVTGKTQTYLPRPSLFDLPTFAPSANVKVVVPSGVNPDQIHTGFNNLEPAVRSVLTSYLNSAAVSRPDEPKADQLARQYSVQNYVDSVMADGYFTNAGSNGFVFMFHDPKGDSPVTRPDGQPLIFTLNDVLAARSPGYAMGLPDERHR